MGDRVCLFVPAVKNAGYNKKIALIMDGPYNILDKLSAVKYRIQLTGGNQKQVVHKNRLKLSLSDPEGSESSTTAFYFYWEESKQWRYHNG